MPTENRSSNTEQMVSVPREWVENYAGMLEERCAYEAPERVQAILAQPANQPANVTGDYVLRWMDDHAATQHQGDPMAAIPDGYCLMPRRLTAENGAKALLLGEFKLEVTRECPECIDLEEPAEGCEICDGEGEYAQRHTIPWEQIKFIYSEAVKGLALQPSPIL